MSLSFHAGYETSLERRRIYIASNTLRCRIRVIPALSRLQFTTVSLQSCGRVADFRMGPGPEHSDPEDRYVLLGMSAAGRLLVVVHVERGDNIRLVSARTADRREAAKYTRSH